MLGVASACAVSVVLAFVSVVEIRSLCILCAATYLTNLALLALSVVEVRRLGGLTALRGGFGETGAGWGLGESSLVILGGVAAATSLWFPKYWGGPAPALARSAAAAALAGGSTVGTTPDGHAWIGAATPLVTIVEFSDYQCPFCARAHASLRALVSEQPRQLRLVHRHFPLDQACNPIVTRPFHPRACEYARLAACAGQQGRFWPANDWLYAHAHDEPAPDAAAVARATELDLELLSECIEGDAARLIDGDLQAGVELKITGTPTFLVGDELYPGQIPPDVLAGLLGRPSG